MFSSLRSRAVHTIRPIHALKHLKMDADVDFDTKRKAFQWCREYLGGAWLEVDFKDFQIRNLRAGLTNYLYKCSLPKKNRELTSHGPQEVLLRIYGEIFTEGSETPLLDTVIFTLLSERNHSPHLYAVFNEGRIEQYIPSRSLRTHELAIPEFSVAIASKLAQFHVLQLPLCKLPRWIDDIIDRWTERALQVTINDVSEKDLFEEIHHVDFEKEAEFLKKLVSKTKSPVVFSHNDCQEGNILYLGDNTKTVEENLVLIDYEYAGYNYRAYDLANHFNEWTMNYSIDTPPYYEINRAAFPTQKQQILFFESYFKKVQEMGFIQDLPTDYSLMLREVKRFVPVNHFIWSLWSVVQAKMSHTTFGFMEYARDRLVEYFHAKSQLPKDMLSGENDVTGTEIITDKIS